MKEGVNELGSRYLGWGDGRVRVVGPILSSSTCDKSRTADCNVNNKRKVKPYKDTACQ